MLKSKLYYSLVYIILVVLFFGCSFKNEKKMQKDFDKHLISQKKLQNSEKIKISENGETKVALTATYLNGLNSLKDKNGKIKEKFIIGLYQSNDVPILGLKSNEQNITLHIVEARGDRDLSDEEERNRRAGYNSLPITAIEINSNSKLLQNIPFINSWSKYYFVEFPHTDNKQFSVIFQNKQFASGRKYSLNFAKNKKYLYFTEEEKKEYSILK